MGAASQGSCNRGRSTRHCQLPSRWPAAPSSCCLILQVQQQGHLPDASNHGRKLQRSHHPRPELPSILLVLVARSIRGHNAYSTSAPAGKSGRRPRPPVLQQILRRSFCMSTIDLQHFWRNPNRAPKATNRHGPKAADRGSAAASSRHAPGKKPSRLQRSPEGGLTEVAQLRSAQTVPKFIKLSV